MSELQHKYHAFLSELGFRPHIEDHEDIAFKFEGSDFLVRVYDGDPGFFRVILPAIYTIDPDTLGSTMVRAVNSVHTRVKAVKLGWDSKCILVHATVETILPFPDGLQEIDYFEAILMRSLGALQYACRQFVREMEEAK